MNSIFAWKRSCFVQIGAVWVHARREEGALDGNMRRGNFGMDVITDWIKTGPVKFARDFRVPLLAGVWKVAEREKCAIAWLFLCWLWRGLRLSMLMLGRWLLASNSHCEGCFLGLSFLMLSGLACVGRDESLLAGF